MHTLSSEEVRVNNLKLAYFMGGVLHKDFVDSVYTKPEDVIIFKTPPDPYASFQWSADKLCYHEDWNWLMGVVEVIKNKGFAVCVCSDAIFIQDQNSLFRNTEVLYEDAVRVDFGEMKFLETLYVMCVNFVGWYEEKHSS